MGDVSASTGIPIGRLAAIEEGADVDPLFAEIVALAGAYGVQLRALEDFVPHGAAIDHPDPADVDDRQRAGRVLKAVTPTSDPAATPTSADPGAGSAQRLTRTGYGAETVEPDDELEVRIATRAMARTIATMLVEHERRHGRHRPARRHETGGAGRRDDGPESNGGT